VLTRSFPSAGLLVNQNLDFEAFTFENGHATSLVKGSLTNDGSKQFLARFLCRLDDLHPQCQIDLDSCLLMFTAKIVSGQGFLGMGGSASVYLVKANGHDSHLALKVFPWSGIGSGQREVTNLQDQSLLTLRNEGSVPTVISSLADVTGWDHSCFAFLMSPVGTPVASLTKPNVKMIFRALAALHRAGWSHGDARLPNFVMCESKVVVIDFAFASKHDNLSVDAYHITQDIFRLVASVMSLHGSNDIRSDPRALVATKMFDFEQRVSREIERYVTERCSDICVDEIAVMVSEAFEQRTKI
jgi:hypothetical protein